MLYKLAHVLRDRFPWIWEMMEWLNGLLFVARYSAHLRQDMGGGNLQRFEI